MGNEVKPGSREWHQIRQKYGQRYHTQNNRKKETIKPAATSTKTGKITRAISKSIILYKFQDHQMPVQHFLEAPFSAQNNLGHCVSWLKWLALVLAF